MKLQQKKTTRQFYPNPIAFSEKELGILKLIAEDKNGKCKSDGSSCRHEHPLHPITFLGNYDELIQPKIVRKQDSQNTKK